MQELLANPLLWLGALALATITAFLTERFTGALRWTYRKITREKPFTITIHSGPVRIAGRSLHLPRFVFPQSIADLPPPPSADAASGKRERWAYSLGGVDADRTSVEITVTGRSDAPVILHDLEVVVLERRRPVQGTHITYGPVGGTTPARWIDVDLDTEPASIVASNDTRWMFHEDDGGIDSDGPPTGHEVEFPYVVTSTAAEVFFIVGNTQKHDCSWVGHLRWSCGSETGVARITRPNGQPFRTTASSNLPTYGSFDGREFIPSD